MLNGGNWKSETTASLLNQKSSTNHVLAFLLCTLMKNSRWNCESSRERSIDKIWVCPHQALIKVQRVSVGIIIRNSHSSSTCWTIKQQPLQLLLLFLYFSPQHSHPCVKHNISLNILEKWSMSSTKLVCFWRSKWVLRRGGDMDYIFIDRRVGNYCRIFHPSKNHVSEQIRD